MELVVPYRVKNFTKFVLSALRRPIITKLLLSFSLNISLPIVKVIGLSTLVSLLPINFEKFIVLLPSYPGLNLPKIRYIDILETTIVGDLLNKDVLIVRNRISSTQFGIEIVKKQTQSNGNNLFLNLEKQIRQFCCQKISFKPLNQPTKTLTDLKREDA